MECFKIEKGKSLVRVFNALPSGEAIDVYIGGVPFFKDVKYKEFTPYIYLIKDIHKIDVYKSGTTEVLIRASLPLPKDQVFTMSTTGNSGEESMIFVEESLDYIPSKEKAIARTINIAPNLGSVNLLYNNNPGVNNITCRDQTPYVYLPAGQYKISLEDSTTGNEIISQNFEFKINRIYSMYIIQKNDTDFEMVQSVDGNTYVCREN